MGSVFRAKHLHLGNDVAIKVLAPHYADDPNLIKRFQREAKVGWALTHPNIIKVSDFGKTEDGILFMVMEYLEGETLDNYLTRSGPLSLQRTLEIIEPLCDALSVAHEQNILHRDLKPANIMISTKKDHTIVKLLDFGIVKLLQPDEHVSALTAVGEVFGTPIYMAPEHLMGLSVGPTADIYSLGVITYMMLTGKLPMDSDDLRKLFEMKMKPLPAPSGIYSFLPKELDEVLQKVLASQLDKRYQNVHEFLADLKKVAAKLSPPDVSNVATGTLPANAGAIAVMPTVQNVAVASSKEAARPTASEPAKPPAKVASPAPASPPKPDTTPSGSMTTQTEGGSSSNTMIIVGVVVLLIIVGVAVIFLAR
ncbi:MAG: serine/threonine protein kinase [Blastocatellia bacterium]|nr:serine/threonine protein kinase [Blastocatellia bacterium]